MEIAQKDKAIRARTAQKEKGLNNRAAMKPGILDARDFAKA
jgi:hypothetical protein